MVARTLGHDTKALVFVVLQAGFQLLDGFVDLVNGIDAMTAEVMGGMLKIFARRAQCGDGLTNLWMALRWNWGRRVRAWPLV